jgi:hypothetical protein
MGPKFYSTDDCEIHLGRLLDVADNFR